MNKYLAASVVILTSFILFGVLVSPRVNLNVVNNNSPIIRIDSSAFSIINSSHSQALNQLMISLSKYGREVFWPIAIMLLFVLGGWTGKKTAVVIALSMLVLIPLGALAKDIVARPRPSIPKSDFLISSDYEFAYPSGHAMIVSAGAAVAIMMFRDTQKRLAISLALAAEAALVCLSRVYVGGHYPLDVIGGILLGVGVSFIFVGIEKHIESLMMPIMNKIVKVKR
ncbi:MAG TPA: phosphatase PAP2 family protein [Nitrososphaeraceae archaeon]|nr:phosphatase PAP2 family protein [Nitrososphaeraceae archaeon]